jgi:oligosaccharide repeat unit polymerase
MYIGVRNEFFKKLSKTRDLVNLSELNVIKIIGYIVLLIGLFPRLYIDIIRIQLYINGNYDLTTTINFSGLFVIISGFFHLGFLLLLIGYKNNNKLAVFILFFSISYNLLIITTGNRGDSVINIFTLLFVYLNTTKKRSYYLYFFLALFGYFFISIVSFIGEIRNLQDRDFLVLTFNFFNNFFSGSYILESISQFGVSIKTIYYSIETFPLLQNYSYGLNYLKSVFVIVPNFLGFTTRLINELTYIYYFPNHSVMGGSYIGELFYAFGYFSIVLISIIGYLISKLYIYLMKSKLNSNWISYSFSIIIILSLLWWIRDYFYVMVREVFYVSIVIFIIHNLLTKKGKYNL